MNTDRLERALKEIEYVANAIHERTNYNENIWDVLQDHERDTLEALLDWCKHLPLTVRRNETNTLLKDKEL